MIFLVAKCEKLSEKNIWKFASLYNNCAWFDLDALPRFHGWRICFSFGF